MKRVITAASVNEDLQKLVEYLQPAIDELLAFIGTTDERLNKLESDIKALKQKRSQLSRKG